MAALLALFPEFLSASAEIDGLIGPDGLGQGFGVHIGLHEYPAAIGVLSNDGYQAVGIEFRREFEALFDIFVCTHLRILLNLGHLLATRCFNCYDAQKQVLLRNVDLSQDGEKRKKRYILNFLRIFVAAGALFLAFKNQNMAELGEKLRQLNPLIFAVAVGLFLFAQVLFVIRWRLLLRVLSVDISMIAGLKLHFLGLFYNNALPSSVGGDFLRAWYVTHHCDRDKRTEAALSVFVDRAIGLTGMILMALAFYLFVPVEGGLSQANASGQGDTNVAAMNGFAEYRWVFLCVVIGFAILFGACTVTRWGRRAMVKVSQKLWGILERILRKALAAATLYSKRPLTIICGIGLTFILQSLCIIGFWLLGRNMGMEAHIKYYFVFFPASWLIGTIPVSIGGLGVIEGTVIQMFEAVGVSKRNASAIAACQRLVWWVSSLPGVFIHLSGAHLPTEKTDFFVDSAEDVD